MSAAQLDELILNADMLLDRTSVIYGESGTGKTKIILDMLHCLRDHVGQIIVISPTDITNKTYSCGIVPLPCIHYKIDDDLLENIWQRQEAFSVAYSRANNINTLKAINDRLGTPEIREAVREITAARDRCLRDIANIQPDQISSRRRAVMDDANLMIQLLYKKNIKKNMEKLRQMPGLSAAEQFAIDHVDLNPRMVIVFDDATNLIKKASKTDVMQNIFYQGRHVFITCIFACHTDKAFGTELRENAYVTIFSDSAMVDGYAKRNIEDKAKKDQASTATKMAFVSSRPFQKLAWIRTEKKFYRYTAKLHEDFRFGSDALWQFCERIAINSGTLPETNKYKNEFGL